MERTLWTDERIDDAMARIEKRFDRIEDELVVIRREIRQLTLMMAGQFVTLAGLIVATSL